MPAGRLRWCLARPRVLPAVAQPGLTRAVPVVVRIVRGRTATIVVPGLGVRIRLVSVAPARLAAAATTATLRWRGGQAVSFVGRGAAGTVAGPAYDVICSWTQRLRSSASLSSRGRPARCVSRLVVVASLYVMLNLYHSSS